jgi:hypothetical protein
MELPIEAVAIVGPYPVRTSEETARNRCIAALVSMSIGRVSNLTFDTRGPDRDKADRIAIRQALLQAEGSELIFDHRGSRDEVLLGLPDCIGWAVGAGGPWMSFVRDFTEVVDIGD